MGIITFNIDAFVNSPPSSIGDNTITIAHNATHVFTIANWSSETTPAFADPDGDIPVYLKITNDPSLYTGNLRYNGITVTQNQVINFAGIKSGLLDYIADVGTLTAYQDDIEFDIADSGSFTYSGLTGTMTMDVEAYVNQPPTTGNKTYNISHGAQITITAADLTTGTTPAYSDPEGDPAAFLRVNTLPANGQLLLNGASVRAGQSISFADIASNLLTYRADKFLDYSRSVNFDFDIQDDTSGQWSS